MREQLPSIFSNLSSARRFFTQVNKETGWAVTCSHDFYIRILDMRIEGDTAAAECHMGFSLADQNFNRTTDTLFFVSDNERWLLNRSGHLFTFLRQASRASIAQIGTLDAPFEVLSQTKDDFVSTSLLAPVTFYHHGKTAIPRFNKTESVNWFGVNCMNSPCGIVADIEDWPGSSNLDHNYLFLSDITSNKMLGCDQDNWVGEFGSHGSGHAQFWGPHGICTVDGCVYLVADMFNHRVVAYRYYNQLQEPEWLDNLAIYCYFNHPSDVEAKDRDPYDLQDITYIAITDEGNHRLVFFHWDPYSLGWDRNYGECGSGEGQFMWPSSVCFGRDPDSLYQTNDVYVTDYGNRRLVRLYIVGEGVLWRGSYEFPMGTELTSVDVDNKGLVYVIDRRNGKVYKFAPSEDYPYYFTLLGIWGERGAEDGQLYYPNAIQVAHGRYVPHPSPGWIPLTGLGDVFISEFWGDQTGVRRFVIAADVLNLTAEWVPYNEDTGEGNFIWWHYNLTDCGTITEQVLRGGEVCTTYNEGTLNWGSQAGSWPVGGHPHGTYYTVKISAGSIYDPSIVVEKTADVYVDTLSTHNPVITQGIRCHWVNEPFAVCDGCWQCIKENEGYIIDVQASHPYGYPLTYEWQCGRGYFWNIGDDEICNPCITDTNAICYVAPEAPAKTGGPPAYEFIQLVVRDPYEGDAGTSIYFNSIFESEYSCLCGDANGNSMVSLGDAVYIQNYLFLGFDPPPDPIERADANNDCVIGMEDMIHILNYLFKNGPPPECCWLHE
jgi:hypothetical protein